MKLEIEAFVSLFFLLLLVATDHGVMSRPPGDENQDESSSSALRAYHLLRKALDDASAFPSKASPSKASPSRHSHRSLASPGFLARPSHSSVIRGNVRGTNKTTWGRLRRLDKIDVPRRNTENDPTDRTARRSVRKIHGTAPAWGVRMVLDDYYDSAPSSVAEKPDIDSAAALAIALAAAHRVHNTPSNER
ncbi:hypothetical protein ACHAXA_001962 [Cyclostephanos tholiformis]|uniref:Uncharacterized protein n=1 Tax=Cyclostephanos tholiformis TaxID=382380 RepID=A0ABD3RRP9_9STRA